MTKKSHWSFLFGIAGVIVIGFVAEKAYQEYKRNQKIEAEISGIRAEAEKMSRNNETLREQIAYFETPEFQEKMAKEKLNFQKAEEEVVIIRPMAGASSDEATAAPVTGTKKSAENEIPNYVRWWRHFFQY